MIGLLTGAKILGGLAVLGFLAWVANDYAGARADRARLEAENAILAQANQETLAELERFRDLVADSQAAHQRAEDHKAAGQDELVRLQEELRHEPPEHDRPLSPAWQRYFDGLRQRSTAGDSDQD